MTSLAQKEEPGKDCSPAKPKSSKLLMQESSLDTVGTITPEDRAATWKITAARWLASQKRAPEPIVSDLQLRFGLTSEEAEEAIRGAKLIHARAH